VLPTRNGVTIRKRCISRPTEHQAILLQHLNLNLPNSFRKWPECSEDSTILALKTQVFIPPTAEPGLAFSLFGSLTLAEESRSRHNKARRSRLQRQTSNTPSPATSKQNEIARGQYLVEEVARCPDCHTPRDSSEGLDRSRWLQGASIWIMPVHQTILGHVDTVLGWFFPTATNRRRHPREGHRDEWKSDSNHRCTPITCSMTMPWLSSRI